MSFLEQSYDPHTLQQNRPANISKYHFATPKMTPNGQLQY